MSQYILRRILIAIPVLLGVTILDFAFISLAPGDAVDALIEPGVQLPPEDLENLRNRLGLDQPALVRYGIWLKELATGNMGYSFTTPRPVADRIAERLPNTLLLTAAALLIAFTIGCTIGVLSALMQYSFLDYFATIFSFIGVSIPNFFFALAAIYIFSVKLKLLPPFGTSTIGAEPSLIDRLRHLIMPASVLGLSLMATFMRYARSALLEVLRQDYVTTARAKGLKNMVVIGRHALRTALLPIITVVGLRLPALFGGSVIVESIFTWPGVGELTLTSTLNRDYPQLMGILLIAAILVLVSNLIADIAYAYADPRIRYE
ncbi:ABC transporter permease [Chloroflexi bacterium TSY]|nr:ABC transporter permease [Chloroflexi bacterium TSY]